MMNVEIPTVNNKVAVEYLKVFYPSLKNEITQLSYQDNLAGIIQATINYIKTLLQESKTSMVARKIKTMEWLYRNGNTYIKDLIENVFIRSFESMRRISDRQQWSLIYKYMPLQFQKIYEDQVKKDELFFKKVHH
ncbi:DUF7674 family protein [Chryseobacterium sp. CT-SW4]|uniref:DUF7674 family protein n=1 Tax=Chryseobacterium sp. SW-1 TaxID=3157343 RepID=UPI003B01467B